MNILKYFSYSKENDFHIYRLNDINVEKLLDTITEDFRLCYITDDDLQESAAKIRISKSEFIEQSVLPDVGKIKSGDFGEMLSYFFIEEHFIKKGFSIFYPRKWLWKEDKNKASPYSDVVGFYSEDELSPSENDFVVCVESKMKATYSNKHRIQEAIDGANKDRVSRLAKTLAWLKQKYTRDGILDKKTFIERYSDPVGKGNYNKIFKAFTIIDKTFEGYEFSLPVKNNNDIAIIVITMKNLKNVYEANLKRIIESI